MTQPSLVNAEPTESEQDAAFAQITTKAQAQRQVWAIDREGCRMTCSQRLNEIVADGGYIFQVLMDDGYEIVWYRWEN